MSTSPALPGAVLAGVAIKDYALLSVEVGDVHRPYFCHAIHSANALAGTRWSIDECL